MKSYFLAHFRGTYIFYFMECQKSQQDSLLQLELFTNARQDKQYLGLGSMLSLTYLSCN